MNYFKANRCLVITKKLRIKYNAFLAMSLIFVLSIFLGAFLISNVKPKTIFKLVGGNKVTVSVNNEYEEKGISLYVNGKRLPLTHVKYNIVSSLNTEKIGKYKIAYNIKYKKKEYTLYRTVSVVDDIKPTITSIDEEIIIYPCSNEDNIKVNYEAKDNYDGDLTKEVKKEIKKDKIILSVKDSSGNEKTLEIPLKKEEDKAPIITINGKSAIYMNLGGTYNEEGAEAKDVCGNKLAVVASGNVDANKEGYYEIKYEAISDSGKTASVTRKVTVLDPSKNNKVVYLTFDDGPGKYTSELLDILARYNVKATFFVTAQFPNYLNMITREANEGHTVAVHTKTHSWNVYSSVDAYLDDFNQMNNIIEQYTGHRTIYFRFPGGSSNTISKSKSRGIMTTLSQKMTELGYKYYDWNVDSEDAAGASSEKIYKNVTEGISRKEHSIVLCHDIKPNTIAVIERILQFGLENGYSFRVIDDNTPIIHHGIQN